MNRLSAFIGIQDALIVHIEMSIILFIKFFCFNLVVVCITQQTEHFFKMCIRDRWSMKDEPLKLSVSKRVISGGKEVAGDVYKRQGACL